jgi:Flp pilus assembly protein TadB
MAPISRWSQQTEPNYGRTAARNHATALVWMVWAVFWHPGPLMTVLFVAAAVVWLLLASRNYKRAREARSNMPQAS